MSEEHTDNLKKARARLIEQRRAFVKVLAGPYERGRDAVIMLDVRPQLQHAIAERQKFSALLKMLRAGLT
jgi:hypothetical protein